MNILVISDSHRRCQPIGRLLETYAKQVQMVAHLGDCMGDLMDFQYAYPDLEMHAVAGNCDWSTPGEITLNTCNSRILLMHGHTQQVKSGYDNLIAYAKEKGANACLFGHTHSPENFTEGSVLFFNPGSVSAPRGGRRPSYGLLSVSPTGEIKGKVLEL